MNDVVISSDNKTVSVGGGARWIEVYKPLVEQGLMVCGGRVAPVGVGGLTTGGGTYTSGVFDFHSN
jgi:FAD/FMN-containing dehydrogenase